MLAEEDLHRRRPKATAGMRDDMVHGDTNTIGVGIGIASSYTRNEEFRDDRKSTEHISIPKSRAIDEPQRIRAPYQRNKRLLILLLGTLITLAFVFLRDNPRSNLPGTYGLCSKEGKIYTVDDAHPQVECIVVNDSKILSVGSLEEIQRQFGNYKKTGALFQIFNIWINDLKNELRIFFTEPGNIIVPGFADAHGHIMDLGIRRNLEINDCVSAEEVVKNVKDYITARPDVLEDKDAWIHGIGWDQTKWVNSTFPTASDFYKEPLLRGRRIVLERVDGHVLWVTERVIEELGPLPDTIDGGEILRTPSGKATGIFVDNAMYIIKPPERTERELFELYSVAVKEALSYGLTSIHDADTMPQQIGFYKRMAESKRLPLHLYLMGSLRVVNTTAGSIDYNPSRFERFVNYGPHGRLTLRSVKLFTDGALGSWGAALVEPYSDRPDAKGLLLHSRESLTQFVRRYWDYGFQTNIHCIGDRANHLALDVFEELLQGENVTERRPRIEHAQIMTAGDLKRIAKLGVIPSVQPTHATSDMWYAEERLGPERIKLAYAYRTYLESSGQHALPLGSDFPVESTNPLLGFYAAITRLSVGGDSPHGAQGWFPEQRLTRAQALKGITLDAAYASFDETRLGSLTPGKLANFVILDTDIMTVQPPQRIPQTRVIATVIDGQPAYGKLR